MRTTNEGVYDECVEDNSQKGCLTTSGGVHDADARAARSNRAFLGRCSWSSRTVGGRELESHVTKL